MEFKIMGQDQSGGAVPEYSGANSDENENTNVGSPDHGKYKRDMLRYKDQVGELSEKLKQYEVSEAEAKGNLSKVIEKLKSENKELKTKYSQDQYNFAVGKIEDRVKMLAAKSGCKDPDVFYKLIDQDSIRAVSVDEKFNPDNSEIETLVNENMKRYEHLGFFEKKINVIDKAPNDKGGASKEKTPSDMTKDELIAYAKKNGYKTL